MTTIRLSSPQQREAAKRAIDAAPEGMVCRVVEPKRSDEQNAKMWAMLQDISRQQPMGRRHTPDDWKAIIMNACGWEVQFLEGLDGRPFPSGFRSSRMTTKQMGTMIDWMTAWGAEQGIRWSHNPYEVA